jgi:photosystem II stability/assembly factor-like uncharacterized protein
MKYNVYLAFILTLICFAAAGQSVELLTSGEAVSIRGMSVVDDQIVWVSGSQGKVGCSVDGGATWQWNQVAGYEKREFRDIEAFDQNTAIILAIAEPGAILKTTDGGKSWKAVYTDSTPGIFMDAFHFNGKLGTVIGDPLAGSVYIAQTNDAGQSWKKLADTPKADSGEACFASSGTNILTMRDGGYAFVTGGLSARLNYKNEFYSLPLVQGKESTGANSIAIMGNHAIVVGGDFAKDTIIEGNAALITFGSVPKITVPATSPHGYRSSVIFIDSKKAITCGTSGVDVSMDGGNNWKLITRDGYHVCQKSKTGTAVYLAGNRGRIARYRP